MKPCSCCLGRSADALHTDPSYPRAVFLGGDGYQCFFLRLPSAQSLFCAPHIGLVDLHATAEPFSAGPHHRAPQLVQQRPGGTVASPDPRCFAVPVRSPRFFWLVTHHNGPKPGAQRQARVLENRARRHRSPDNRIAHTAGRPRRLGRALRPPQRGHTKPCGQRSCIRYSRHACSVAKRPSNSSSVRG